MTSTLLDALPIAAALVGNDGTVIETNAAWRGLGPRHRVPCPPAGCSLPQALDLRVGAGDLVAQRVRAGIGQVLAAARPRVEIDYEADAGQHYRLELRAFASGCVATHVDVSGHWRAVMLAEQHARQDPLTGLDNRRGLTEQLQRALAESDTRPSTLALVDLDDFKLVNDRFGHTVGDRLLQRIGRRLVDTVRPGDVVARLGGDEFAVLAPGLVNAEATGGLVDRLRAAIEAPLDTGGHHHRVGASIGSIVLDGNIVDVTAALALVDRRMYRDKRQRTSSTALRRSA